MKGVVLIGGKSKRMKLHKAFIQMDQQEWYLRSAKLLHIFCDEVYISGREEQEKILVNNDYTFIKDRYEDIGPIAGILSSFESLDDYEDGILLIATDMPFLDKSTIEKLIIKRNRNKMATMFKNAESGFLEPLCGIYEKDAYKKIKLAVENGEYAVHRIFSLEMLEIVEPDTQKSLTNINFPYQLKGL